MTEDLNDQTFKLEKAERRMAFNRLQALQIAAGQTKTTGYTSTFSIALDTIRLAEHYSVYLETGIVPKVKA